MHEFSSTKVKIGQWVNIIDRKYRLYEGYVVSIHPSQDSCVVKIIRGEKGTLARGKQVIEMDMLEPMDDFLEEEDLMILIDMALDLGDKEWFQELTNQLPVEMSW